jgi:hypothetical protein
LIAEIGVTPCVPPVYAFPRPHIPYNQKKTGKTVHFIFSMSNIDWLPVEMEHCEEIVGLPFHRRDPFDRLPIAQATV